MSVKLLLLFSMSRILTGIQSTGTPHLGNILGAIIPAIEESKTAMDSNPQKLVELAQAIKFNGGGHYNHEFFWDSLKPISEGGGNLPDANGPPNSKLAKMIMI